MMDLMKSTMASPASASSEQGLFVRQSKTLGGLVTQLVGRSKAIMFQLAEAIISQR